MKQLFLSSILVSSAVCFGPSLNAVAQDIPPHYNTQYGASGASDFRNGQMLFASVRSDLDRAENNLPEYAGGRYQFDRVRGELSELQRQWDETAYEPSHADHVIRALDRALDSGDLLARDRDRLAYDLTRLREFRDSHE